MNRKILYGYQIRDGELNAQPQEAEGVKQIFSLYLAGAAQQRIADALNADGFPYSAESTAWSRPRVMQVLRNSRYMGEKGYPALIDAETFHAAQTMRAERARKWGDHPALCLVRKLRCGHCGHSLRRLAQSQWSQPGQSWLGGRLHHHPLLPLQCAGHIQRRAFPEGRTDGVLR